MHISCPCDSHEVTTLIISVFEVLRNLVAQDPIANKVTKQIFKLKSSHLLIPLPVSSALALCAAEMEVSGLKGAESIISII